jgi:hypothetical protein
LGYCIAVIPNACPKIPLPSSTDALLYEDEERQPPIKKQIENNLSKNK